LTIKYKLNGYHAYKNRLERIFGVLLSVFFVFGIVLKSLHDIVSFFGIRNLITIIQWRSW